MRLFVVALSFFGACAAFAADGTWEEVAKTEVGGRGLVVQTRVRAGSDVREVRGLGSFEAPPWVIKNVIDDVSRYQEFMPYTKKSTLEKGGDGFVVSYQRLAVPLADDRDYTIRIYDESVENAAGAVTWKNRWSSANNLGPAPIDGVIRVAVNEGYWQLEDLDGGKHTKVVYYVYTNPGGALPAFLVNAANEQAVPELFKAVNKASKEPRYQKTKPVPRTSQKAAPPTTTAPTAPTAPTTTPAPVTP